MENTAGHQSTRTKRYTPCTRVWWLASPLRSAMSWPYIRLQIGGSTAALIMELPIFTSCAHMKIEDGPDQVQNIEQLGLAISLSFSISFTPKRCGFYYSFWYPASDLEPLILKCLCPGPSPSQMPSSKALQLSSRTPAMTSMRQHTFYCTDPTNSSHLGRR